MRNKDIFSERLSVFEIGFLANIATSTNVVATLIEMAEKGFISFEENEGGSIFKITDFKLKRLSGGSEEFDSVDGMLFDEIDNEKNLSSFIKKIYYEGLVSKMNESVLESLKKRGLISGKRFLFGLSYTDRGKRVRKEIINLRKKMKDEVMNSAYPNAFYDFFPIAFSLGVADNAIGGAENSHGKDYFRDNSPSWYHSESGDFNPRKFNKKLVIILAKVSKEMEAGIR